MIETNDNPQPKPEQTNTQVTNPEQNPSPPENKENIPTINPPPKLQENQVVPEEDKKEEEKKEEEKVEENKEEEKEIQEEEEEDEERKEEMNRINEDIKNNLEKHKQNIKEITKKEVPDSAQAANVVEHGVFAVCRTGAYDKQHLVAFPRDYVSYLRIVPGFGTRSLLRNRV